MAAQRDPVSEAYRRVAILKAIISAERQRAESKPYDDRNLKLGIIEPDQPQGKAPTQIKTLFNELELFIDHLTLVHMAAVFETAAKHQLDTVAGEARAAIRNSRNYSDGWAAKLVRGADSFQGLHDIGEVLGLSAEDLKTFKTIRNVRNDFSHGAAPKTVPPIPAETARTMLVGTLARIK